MDASLIISMLALLVAILVGVLQLLLQRRMTRIEESRRQEEVTSRLTAEVTARIESYQRYTTVQAKGYKFVLENLGPAPAQDVTFEVQRSASGEAPLVQMDGHNFPISLDPHQSYEMLCIVVMGTAPSVDVDVAWKDGTGPRTKRLTLTVY
jgi:hypothetical protein